MLWLCFKLPSCLFGNTRDMSLCMKKQICLFYLYATAKSEIQICSNKHETGLVFKSISQKMLHLVIKRKHKTVVSQSNIQIRGYNKY